MTTDGSPKPKRTKFIDEVSDAVVEKMREAWSEIRDLIAAEPPTPTVMDSRTSPQAPPPTPEAKVETTPEPSPEPTPEPTPPTISSPHSAPKQRSGFNILR